MNHCSSVQLQSYLDKRLDHDEDGRVRAHLRTCEQCTRAYKAIARIDDSLKRLPRESLSAAFTQSVMAKLHSAPKSSLLFKLLENVAYLFGLLLVLGTMVVVFILTGTVDQRQVSETQGAVSEALLQMGGAVSGALASLTAWMHQLFPFAFAKGSIGITTFGILVVAALAVVDWFVRRRYVHRY